MSNRLVPPGQPDHRLGRRRVPTRITWHVHYRPSAPNFIEINGKALVIVGNIFRPPRDVLQNYQTFTSELASIITVLSKSKCEVVLSGDYNIDLLKLNDNTNISDFFDTITSLTFYPIITLPTRFSDRRCTLIDNFICKFSPEIMNSTTGILTNNISDHQPYLINIHNLTTTQKTPTFIHINTQNYNSMNNFKMKIGNANIYLINLIIRHC